MSEKNIIAFGKAKGGVGNTTTAVNIMYLRAKEKGSENVILVDADSVTKTATIWIALRSEDPVLFPLLTMQGTGDKSLVQAIKILSDKYPDIIMDIGGGNDMELLAAMATAKKLYIPVRPSFIDTFAFYALDNKIGQAQGTLNPDLKAFIYPCVVSPNVLMVKSDLEEIKTDLISKLTNIKLSQNIIYDRKVYRSSPKFDGKTIFELTGEYNEKHKKIEKKDPQAEQEMINFYKEIYEIN